MDLKKFKFPKPNMCLPLDKKLFKEAEKRGFLHGHTPHNKLFNSLFFQGGEVKFKKDVDPDFADKIWPYLKAFMGSFEPKHEYKEAVCAMLLSELVEVPK